MHRRARHVNPAHAGAFLALDSRFISGLSDGDPVATWPDRTSNGNDAIQATADYQPTFQAGEQGGCPVVRFPGTSEMDVTLSLTQFTAVMVTRRLGACSGTYHNFWYLPAAPYKQVYALSDKFRFYDNATFSSNLDFLNEAQIISVIESSVVTIYQNGINGYSSACTPVEATGTFKIGAATSAKLNGDIATLIMYPSALSAPLRRRLEHAAAYSFKIACS